MTSSRFARVMKQFFSSDANHNEHVKSRVCKEYDDFMALSAQRKRREFFRIHQETGENLGFECCPQCKSNDETSNECTLIPGALQRWYIDGDKHEKPAKRSEGRFIVVFDMSYPNETISQLRSDEFFLFGLCAQLVQKCQCLSDTCIVYALSPHDATFSLHCADIKEKDYFTVHITLTLA